MVFGPLMSLQMEKVTSRRDADIARLTAHISQKDVEIKRLNAIIDIYERRVHSDSDTGRTQCNLILQLMAAESGLRTRLAEKDSENQQLRARMTTI
jgi:hypothetical protein